MLVYGDRVRVVSPRAMALALAHQLVAPQPSADLARHAAIVASFVEIGELAQGLADADRTARGRDARAPIADAAMTIAVSAARAIMQSWSGLAVGRDVLRSIGVALRILADRPLPDAIAIRRAEGYAFYAVYPEAYLAAASSARSELGGARVIGIRSIGASLAALVAAATGAPLPATVRPSGDPFRREIHVAPELAAEWRASPIAIADEGPGMSGSSFGAVIDLLEARGVPRARIACFPSHRGDLGPRADPRHRDRWQRMRRHVVTCDDLLVTPGRLAGWLAALPAVGPAIEPLVDLSAGAWRAHRYARIADWPAAVVQQERRKFLARTATGTWLARFVGLGRDEHRAASNARVLDAAGFTPELAGTCHGFLVERWLDGAPISRMPRDRLVEHVGRYLAIRARLPAPHDGASPAALLAMIRRNTTLALGPDASGRHAHWEPRLAVLARRARPCAIDGRLHAWEWLVTPAGALVKTDAHDHHASHDLIGCQDIAWDVAGAEVELALDRDEAARLAAIVARETGRGVDPELVAFSRCAYLAFQLGRNTLAAEGADPAEAARLTAEAARYTTGLRALAG